MWPRGPLHAAISNELIDDVELDAAGSTEPILARTISGYDASYNLPSGTETDFSNRTIERVRTADRKDVARVNYDATIYETFAYDAAGQLTSHRAVDGTTESWTYDATTSFATTHRTGTVTTSIAYGACTTATLALTTEIHRSVLGEYIGKASPLGVDNGVYLDAVGRASREGPTFGSGLQHGFDPSERLSTIIHANGEHEDHSTFDEYGNPRSVALPGGGSIAAAYDRKGRLTSRDVSFKGRSFREEFAYDGLDRVRSTTFAGGTSTFEYDLLGVRTRTQLKLGGPPLTLEVTPDANGAPTSVKYPSGTTIEATRSEHGRLEHLLAAGQTVTSSMTYATAWAPATMRIGRGIDRTDTYDHRRRLVSRSYVRNGEVLAELRYAYDEANRERVRQSMHMGGRADLFEYDRDGRLTHSEIAARPKIIEAENSDWAVPDDHFVAGDYGREYQYDNAGRDRLEAIVTNRRTEDMPPPHFAELFESPDDAGHPTVVDGVSRTVDALGNTTNLTLESGEATLEYDGLSRLVKVTRPDLSTIDYEYRADGPLVRRTVVCGNGAQGCEDSHRVYVYDGLNLLEEWEMSSGRQLVARYYYADEGDIPIGADLWSGTSMDRHYFVTDRIGSVIGVLDADGNWEERIRYDAWGYPIIEQADHDAPVVCELDIDPTGDIIVVFCEPVLPQPVPPSGATGISTSCASLDDAVIVTDPTGSVPATASLDETYPNHPRGTAVRIHPSAPIATGTSIEIELLAGKLYDTWANANAATTFAITNTAGLTIPLATTSTAPSTHERSQLGNALLFQSHLYDYDADLYLMRARVFDPRTGAFLSRDPLGYEDSVNLYAFGRNDPVNVRDPSGMSGGLDTESNCVAKFGPEACGMQPNPPPLPRVPLRPPTQLPPPNVTPPVVPPTVPPVVPPAAIPF
ncbi:MAG: RHS repeat-associated core domain-containing protein, partial [Actinomycetota bacterium]